MTTTFSHAVSTAFQVKSVSDFSQSLNDVLGVQLTVENLGTQLVRLQSDSGWALQRGDDDTLDLADILQGHLQENAVAHFRWMTVEGTSIMGGIISINSDGETVSQTLAGLQDYANATLGAPEDDSPEAILAGNVHQDEPI